MRIVITGKPKSGKTTLVCSLLPLFSDWEGFYTTEIREGKERKGFLIHPSSGKKEILAHKDLSYPHRWGRYRVNLEGLEMILETLRKRIREKKNSWVVIDEVGNMEMLSEKFRSFINNLKDFPGSILLTAGERWLEEVRSIFPYREEYLIRRENWEEVREKIEKRVRREGR